MQEYIEQVSEIYAKAIFDLAKDTSAVDDIGEDLQQISLCIDDDKEFAEFLASPSISTSAKMQVVTKIFDGKVNELTMNMLMVMAQRDRLELLRTVYSSYKSMQDDISGRIYGTITTAYQLDDSAMESVRVEVSTALSKDITLKYKVDPSIIGGMTLQIGTRFIDGSIQNKLAKMAKTFMKNKLTDPDSVIEM